MLDETFYLDGVDAKSVGIRLHAPIKFSGAVPVVNKQTVPGRNGDLLFYDGSYENRTASASCFCLQENVQRAFGEATRFLMGKNGYRRLETSDDKDHFWLARVKNSPRIDMRAGVLAPFEIEFDCKPQRFLKTGENTITMTEPGAIPNITQQTALPLIRLEGQVGAPFTVGDTTMLITFVDDKPIYLDCDQQNAYDEDGNANRRIKASSFPVLKPGLNEIYWNTGITKVEIIPRWWEL